MTSAAAQALATAPLPPQNLDAEESVLGAMLLSPTAIEAVVEVVDAGDFYRESHGTIYQAMLDLHAVGEPVDALTLVEHLKQAGQLDAVGGRATIDLLAASVPAVGHLRPGTGRLDVGGGRMRGRPQPAVGQRPPAARVVRVVVGVGADAYGVGIAERHVFAGCRRRGGGSGRQQERDHRDEQQGQTTHGCLRLRRHSGREAKRSLRVAAHA